MDCKNKVNDTNCDKSISKAAKIATNIVWMKEFEYSDTASNTIKSINIDCNGKIIINKNNNENIDVHTAIYLYCKLIKNWYSVYFFNKQLDSYKYIKNKFKELRNLTSIDRLRIHAITISKYLECITVCNGICSTVTPGKEVGNCKIPLSNINKIVKFSSEGLVDVLNTIFYTLKDIAILNLSIDLDTTYVVCNGNIIMDKTFIKSKSTVADMKSIYTYYLSAWCSANICKESEVAKVRENINEINKVEYMHEMYNLSNDLLELLLVNTI